MFKRYLSGCLLVGIFAGVFVGTFGYSLPAGAQGVDSYNKLMLHADGSDQGTSFTDSSSGAKTVTNNESYDSYTKLMLHMENNLTDSAAGKTVTNNNVAFSSSFFKMGGNSGVFNGSNAYLSLADSDDWNFGSGDFTIDFWVRFSDISTHRALIGQQGVGSDDWWRIMWHSTDGLKINDPGSGLNVEWAWTPAVNTWYHLALVRSGNNWYMFVNGVNLGTKNNSLGINNYSTSLGLGYHQYSTLYHNGSLVSDYKSNNSNCL